MFSQVDRLHEAALPPGKRPAILLTGETGTGKGVVARAIHARLGDGPFIEVNCTAMPASLVEAELFGHERGTFTDAKTSRTGLFEAANGGTLFLDEIGELEGGLQAKFLKAIEEKRIRRLGSTRDRAVDVQVIAATNRDLDAAVRAGAFRADLLHRLRVLAFEIPPLRARGDDLLILARHFAAELGQTYGGAPRTFTPEAAAVLQRYAWPGNVRELRNLLERTVLLHRETEIGAEAIEEMIGPARPLRSVASAPDAAAVAPSTEFALPDAGVDLQELERALIEQALARTGGNRTRAAALLGLTRDTLALPARKARDRLNGHRRMKRSRTLALVLLGSVAMCAWNQGARATQTDPVLVIARALGVAATAGTLVQLDAIFPADDMLQRDGPGAGPRARSRERRHPLRALRPRRNGGVGRRSPSLADGLDAGDVFGAARERYAACRRARCCAMGSDRVELCCRPASTRPPKCRSSWSTRATRCSRIPRRSARRSDAVKPARRTRRIASPRSPSRCCCPARSARSCKEGDPLLNLRRLRRLTLGRRRDRPGNALDPAGPRSA